MPFDDRTTDGDFPQRSLSEQLRELEAQAGHANEIALPRIARRTKLPTCLGRPIGLTRPDGFPRIATLVADPDERVHLAAPPPSRAARLRRAATVVGAGLLLLASTAIVPPLLLRHAPTPPSPPPEAYRLTAAPRTDSFAHSARELQQSRPADAASMTLTPVGAATTLRDVPRTTARYEPTAAEGETVLDAIVLPPPRVR